MGIFNTYQSEKPTSNKTLLSHGENSPGGEGGDEVKSKRSYGESSTLDVF
jgi:hypothetical protein